MAFRRRGRRRSFGRNVSRGSRFAPARRRGGNLSWESMVAPLVPGLEPSNIMFPTQKNASFPYGLANTVTADTFYRLIIPVNPTRGVVSLRRIVMDWHVALDTTAVNAFGQAHHFTMKRFVALAPADANLTPGTIVGPMYAANSFLEGPEVLWQDTILARAAGSTSLDPPVDVGNLLPATTLAPHHIDIKTMRRFDRQEWGLVAGIAIPLDAWEESYWYHSMNMRMLFVSPDGI